MNKIIYFVCLLGIQLGNFYNAYSQSKETYLFKNAIDLSECNFNGDIYKRDGSVWSTGDSEDSKKAKVVIQNYLLFKVMKVIPTGYIIHILNWGEDNKSTIFGIISVGEKTDLNAKNKGKNLLYSQIEEDVSGEIVRREKYFFVSNDDFKNNVIEKVEYPRWEFNSGVVSLPIKMRFASPLIKVNGKEYREQYFNVNSDVNVGLSAGVKWRPKKNQNLSISLLGGVNLTSIQVDSSTTKGYVRSSINASSLTPVVSIVFEYKDFQIGIFTGNDILSRELGDNWSYNGKSWVGLGLGYNILGTSTKPSSATTNTK